MRNITQSQSIDIATTGSKAWTLIAIGVARNGAKNVSKNVSGTLQTSVAMSVARQGNDIENYGILCGRS